MNSPKRNVKVLVTLGIYQSNYEKKIYLLFIPLLLIQCLSLKSGVDPDSDLAEIAKWSINAGELEAATIL